MSLVETLVALSILSIVMAGMITINANQQRETRSLSEKIAALDAEKLLIQTMTSSSLCHRMLVDKDYSSTNPQTFDPKLIDTEKPPVIKLPGNKLVASSSSTAALFKVGAAPSPDIPSLVVQSIHIDDLEPAGNDLYKATLEVQFQNSRLIRPIKSAKTTLLLTTEDVPKSHLKQIVGCGNSTREPASMDGLQGQMKRFTSSGSWKVPEGVTQIRVTVVGGGGGVNYSIGSHQALFQEGEDSYIEGCDVRGHGGDKGGYINHVGPNGVKGGKGSGGMIHSSGGSGSYGGNCDDQNESANNSCVIIPGGASGGHNFPYVGGSYGAGGSVRGSMWLSGGGGGAAVGVCEVTPGSQIKIVVGRGGNYTTPSAYGDGNILIGLNPTRIVKAKELFAQDGVVLIEW